jgi:hypothetical protein
VILHKDGDFMFGIWEAEANTTAWLDYPCHEWMVLLEGSVAVIEEKKVSTFKAGDCFTIAHHTRCIWSQSGRVRKFFVATTEGKLTDGKLPVALIDAGDQSVSFAISKSVNIWGAGPLQIGARKLKVRLPDVIVRSFVLISGPLQKGEKIGQPNKHSVLHVVDASPRLDGATVFEEANAKNGAVAEEDMVAVYCTYAVPQSGGSKL